MGKPAKRAPAIAAAEPVYRQRFENVVGRSIQGILVHRDRRIVFANAALARMYGYRSPDQLIGTIAVDLIAPEDQPRVLAYGKLRKAGKPAPKQYEFRAVHRTGKPMWAEARVNIIDWDGKQSWLVTLLDVTERRLAEQRLAESEERFRILVEGSLEGINVLVGRKLVFCNQAFADIFGYRDPAHVLRHPVWERFQAPLERKRMKHYAENRVRGKPAPPRYEFQGQRRDGTVIWLEASVRRILWRGQPALQGTLMDITERKRAEAALASSQELLRTVIDTMPQSIFAKDRKGRYILASRSLAGFYGLRPEQVIGRTDLELPNAGKPQTTRFRQADRRVLARGETLHLPDQLVENHLGQPTWRAIHKMPLRDADGAIIGVVGVSEDVTQRREAEAEVQAQRATLQTLIDAMPYPISFKDRDLKLRVLNRAFLEVWRKPVKEFLGKRIDEVVGLSTKVNAEVLRDDQRVLSEGRRIDNIGVPIRTHTRQVVRHLIKVPVKDARGNISGILTISEDITARRKAEEDLLASKRLLEEILANIPVGLSLVDKELNVVATNDQFFQLLGFPKGFRRNARTFADFVRFNALRGEYGPGDVEQQVAERVELAKRFQPHRFERVRPGGPALEIRGNPLPGGGFITTYMDITERRRAQEQLLANQRLLRTVLDSLPHFLTVKDSQGRYTLVNQAFAAFWSQPPEAFVGFRPRDLQFMDREYWETIELSDHQVLREGASVDNVTRQMMVRGTTRYQRVVKVPVKAAGGAVEGVVALVEDISAQRLADEQLRAGQRLQQAIFDTIPHRLWVKDVEGRFLLVNHAQARFHGLTPNQMVNLSTAELPGLPAALKAALSEQDQRVLKHGAVIDEPEFAFPTASGSEGWTRLIKLPLRDGAGKIVGEVGLAEDVTDRKRAELEARNSRRLLQTVFDTMPQNMMVKDMDGRYLMVNQAVGEFHGLTTQQMLGRTLEELSVIATPQGQVLVEADRAVAQTGQRVDVPPLLMRDAAGEDHWMQTVKFPLLDDDGRVAGVVTVGEDVTERRRHEEELWASRELLRKVFNTIPTFLMVKDQAADFVLVNAAAARFEGLPPETFHGMPTQRLPRRTPEQMAEIIRTDRLVLDTGEELDIGEYHRLNGVGEMRWLRGRKMPLMDEHGHVSGVLGIVEDITEHKLALQQLQASRHLLQTVFDALPLRVSVRDAEGRYVMVNRRMAEDHQQSPDSFIGHRLWDDQGSLDEDQRLVIERVLLAIQSRQAVVTPELPIMLPGKNRRLVRSTLIPLFDAEGALTGVLGIGEDITERKKGEQALLQAQKLESLGVLAGGIAHDFNNLLVTIMGNASLAVLKMPPGSPSLEELQQIEMAGQRAADLCKQMLSYAGKGRLEKQPVNLNQLVQEMTQLLRVSLPKGVAVNFRLMPDLPLTEADPTQMRQVIMNLVINAGEAIGANAGTILLATSVMRADREYFAEAQIDQQAQEGEYVVLDVSDTGVGMDAQTRARIFDPFFTTKFTGRGLGLASVLGIVRGHGGGLKVYSELGQGTSFKVLLPVVQGSAPSTSDTPPAGEWSGGGTVLVIDDEQAIRSVAARMLTRLGFQVLEAADGAAAVELMRNPPTPLTAALLDLTMPGLSGEETLRQLRRIDKGLPVILMSGYNEREVLDRFVGRELAGFLQKPFKLDALRDKLRELFEESGNSPSAPRA